MKTDEEKKKILYNCFNQDYKCFLIGTKDGCRIYNSEPFQKGFKLSKLYIYLFFKIKNRTRRRIFHGDNVVQNKYIWYCWF